MPTTLRPSAALALALATPAMAQTTPKMERVEVSGHVENVDRAVGTVLSGELARRGLARGGARAIVRLKGSAGQSFGGIARGGRPVEAEAGFERGDRLGRRGLAEHHLGRAAGQPGGRGSRRRGD